jgi:hemin uptake protein HemP
VLILERAVKLCQLTGDVDRQTGLPTRNRTMERHGLVGTDLGVPFRHKGRTYLLFGDTVGPRGGDAIAWTTDRKPEDGLDLTFMSDAEGYLPLRVPGIGQGPFEVPMAGISLAGRMYVYHTTDHTDRVTMGRSVLAASDDDGATFRLLYDLSTRHFINVSPVVVRSRDWPGLPTPRGDALLLFGSGSYRRSDVRLACQATRSIGDRASIRYWEGMNGSVPRWSHSENDAAPLFRHPVVGELSVAWNRHLALWVMLYNSSAPRGIVLRVARQPWGPWSEAQVIFDPWKDGGYGRFMHVSRAAGGADALSDPGREDEWGGEYGPYQLAEMSTGGRGRTAVYFTMSTWNPYAVVLMRVRLALPAVR